MVKPGYKQTEIGEIPEDWEEDILGNVVGTSSGGTPSRNIDAYYRGNIPWITTSELRDGYIYDTYEHISDEALRCSSAKLFPSNTVLMAMYGATIGRLGITKIKSSTNQACCAFICGKNIFNKYLYYYLFYIRNYIVSLGSGAGQPNISQKIIQNLPIILPKITEQQRIAEALSDVDALIASLEKLIAKKKAIKQGAMQRLLTGKTRLPGFEGEWKERKLGDYCSLVTKQTGFDYSAYIKPALIKEELPDTLPMIQTINFRGKNFSFNTDYYIPKSVAIMFPNIILNSKCVLFSIVGASVGNVGLYPGGISFCGGAICITRFIHEQDSEWVYYYMCSHEGKKQIDFVTKGGAQATVTIADIRNFIIPEPEEKEKTAIVNVLFDMDKEIESLSQKLAKTRQLKQGMMQQLLTGKIRLV